MSSSLVVFVVLFLLLLLLLPPSLTPPPPPPSPQHPLRLATAQVVKLQFRVLLVEKDYESVVCWLLNVPAACKCISGMDLLPL